MEGCKKYPKRLQNEAWGVSGTSLGGHLDHADGGVKKRDPQNRFGRIFLGGLFGVFFALGHVQAQRSVNLKHLLGGFVFGSDYGTFFGQVMDVCGRKNIDFAWEGLQKSNICPSWFFDHFGSHFGGHFGDVWGPEVAV